MKFSRKKLIFIVFVIIGCVFVYFMIAKINTINKVENHIETITDTLKDEKQEYFIHDNNDTTYTIYDVNGNPIRTVDEITDEGMREFYKENPYFNPNPVLNN